MTHPIVSAYVEAFGYPEYPSRPKDVLRLMQLDDIVAEVVASESKPEFMVGFYCGENNQLMFVWLWPLKRRFVEEVQFWLDNKRYEYDFCWHKDMRQLITGKAYTAMLCDCLT